MGKELVIPGGRRLVLGKSMMTGVLLSSLVLTVFVPVVVFGVIVLVPSLSPLYMMALMLLIPVVIVPCCILAFRILQSLRWLPQRRAVKAMEYELGRLRVYMDTSRLGQIWMVTQILLSLAACVLYVVEQYSVGQRDVLDLAELLLSVLFGVDYLIFFACAEDRLVYFFSFFALIDLFTVYPVFASILFDALRSGSVFLRPLRVLRALRIIRAYRLFSFSSSDVQRQLMAVGLTVFSLIFCSAALIQFVETYGATELTPSNPFFYFHDCLYFVTVMFTTVGFGDITPATEAGRMVVTCLILFSMFMIPYQSFKLVSLLSSSNRYLGKVAGRKAHVVVLGHITAHGTLALFRELFHKESKFRNTPVVLLSAKEPDYGLRRLLSHPFYKHRVAFLIGSALQPRDLQRASLDTARACFVLCNKFDVDTNRADSETSMMMLAVKDFNRNLYTCGQLLSAEHKHTAEDLPRTDVVVLEEMNLSILSRNCLVPGFSTLIANLTQTYSNSDRSEHWAAQDWRSEYHYGCSHELYSIELPQCYHGMRFSDAALLIYQQHHQTLVAANCDLDDGSTLLLVNPTDSGVHRLVGGTVCFVLALSAKQAKRIATTRLLSAPSLSVEIEHPMEPMSNRRQAVAKEGLDEPHSQMSMEVGEETWVQEPVEDGWHALSAVTRTLKEVVNESGCLGEWASAYPGYMEETPEQERRQPPAGISGHIVVTGSLDGLMDFMAPLRSVGCVERVSVVIVNSVEIPDAIWEMVGRFPDVFVVRGSLSNYQTLRMAQLETARSVLLLTNPVNRSLEQEMIDAEAIFTFRRLVSRFKVPFLVTELAHGDNVRFISPGIDPEFAFRQEIWRSTGVSSLTTSGELLHPEYHYNPFFAGGQVYTSSVLDSLMCRLPHKPELRQMLEILTVGGTTPQQMLLSSHVYQFPVEAGMEGVTYLELYEHMVTHHAAVPLGLYRMPHAGGSTSLPYVFTNPSPDTVVGEGDRVFALASAPAARSLLQS